MLFRTRYFLPKFHDISSRQLSIGLLQRYWPMLQLGRNPPRPIRHFSFANAQCGKEAHRAGSLKSSGKIHVVILDSSRC